MREQKAAPESKGAQEVKAYLLLARPTNALMVFLAAIITGIVAGAPFSCTLPAALGAALVSAGAQAINDYYDYEVDRKKGKQQLLERGKILRAAITFYALGVAVAVLASFFLGVLAALAAFLSWVYSAHLRRVKYVGNLVVAFLTAFVFIFAGICGDVSRVLFLFLLTFLVSWAREIVKDVEDLPADYGHKVTLPMLVGEQMAGYLAAYFILLAVFFSLFPGPFGFNIFSIWYYYVLVVAHLLLIVSVLYILRGRSREAQRLCKAGMLVALLAFAAGTVLP